MAGTYIRRMICQESSRLRGQSSGSSFLTELEADRRAEAMLSGHHPVMKE
jgi:hypothetical protein